MRDNKKQPTVGAPSAVAKSGSAGSAKDVQSEKLSKLGAKLGNDEIQRRLDKGNASRDELLAFLSGRLGAIRNVQLKEMGEMDLQSMRESWRKIADSHKAEYTTPDPTRWRESARIYEEAAHQIARGALDQGRQLVERGINEEKKALEDVPAQVGLRASDKEVDQPSVLSEIAPGESCAASGVPLDIRALSHEIQNVTAQEPEPPGRRRVRDPWWTLDEEEEEEEGAEGGGA